jgi:hypothetical protein
VAGCWDALVEGDYEAVMPLPAGKRFGIRYVFQPPYTQQLGMFARQPGSAERVGDFLNAVPRHFRMVEYSLNSHNNIPAGQKGVSYWQNYELDLISGSAGIRSRYNQNLRRNLQKADAAGLTVHSNVAPNDIVSLFSGNQRVLYNVRVDRDQQKIRRLIYTAMHKGLAETYGVTGPGNQICAAAMFLRSGMNWVFLFSGADEFARQNGAMAFLIDHFIARHAGTRMILDFEGSNREGLARFYGSFGSRRLEYPHISLNMMPFAFRFAYKVYRKYR